MLSTTLILEIDRLLKEKQLSHRRIAQRLRVSRSTVSAIASGRRGLHGRNLLDSRKARTQRSLPLRCPGCGHRVYMPCLVCRTRRVRYMHTALVELHNVMPPRRAG